MQLNIMVITAHYSELQTPKEISTTLQYPKCKVVTTSGIEGLQGNSIKYHTLDKGGTQKYVLVAICSMMLTTPGDFMVLGVT